MEQLLPCQQTAKVFSNETWLSENGFGSGFARKTIGSADRPHDGSLERELWALSFGVALAERDHDAWNCLGRANVLKRHVAILSSVSGGVGQLQNIDTGKRNSFCKKPDDNFCCHANLFYETDE